MDGVRSRFRITLLALCWTLPAWLGFAGCVDINGGAVEIAWSLFTRDGRAITNCACSDPAIPYVRLHLVSETASADEPCTGTTSCRFSCNRKIGATPFMIPPGRYLMSLVAVGADGADLVAGLVESPAPQSRQVVSGQPTELEAYMLSTNCATHCHSDSFTTPCSSN